MYLLTHGNGTFASVSLILTVYNSHPFLIVAGDFNKDRKMDFALINEGADNLQIFLQKC